MKNEIDLTMPGIPPKAELDAMPRGQRFDLLTPHEMRLILACTHRACQSMSAWRLGFASDQVIEINPTVVSADFAVVHLLRNLDLQRMVNASEMDFISDYTLIEKNINRAAFSFPAEVALRHAQIGAVHN